MKENSPPNLNNFSQNDPIQKPWVIPGFLLLFLLMIPVWPVEGNWWGIPAWAVLALIASLLTSIFTAFVICCAWKEDEND